MFHEFYFRYFLLDKSEPDAEIVRRSSSRTSSKNSSKSSTTVQELGMVLYFLLKSAVHQFISIRFW